MNEPKPENVRPIIPHTVPMPTNLPRMRNTLDVNTGNVVIYPDEKSLSGLLTED